MFKSLTSWISCFIILQLIAIGDSADDSENPGLQQLGEGIGNLSTNILKKLATSNGNTLFSAYGISSALAMCMFGAEGHTYTALHETLGLSSLGENEAVEAFRDAHRMISSVSGTDSNTQQNTTLSSENALFGNKSLELRTEFLETLHRVYPDAIGESVDFKNRANETQRVINSFVEEATRGKIPNLLNQPLDPRTLLAIINAVYFKGSWKTAFKFKQSDDTFNNFTCPNVQLKVDQKPHWMTLTSKFLYARSSELRAHILELPYQSSNDTAVSMLLILPYEKSKCEFASWLEQSMEWTKITDVMTEMRETRIDLTLPKFKLTNTLDMKEPLSSLGLKIVFSDRASFQRMLFTETAVPISNFLHKAKMSVDELGTEAAAASGAFLRRRSRPLPSSPPLEIVFDRSFVCMIIANQHGSRLPLFTAAVNEV